MHFLLSLPASFASSSPHAAMNWSRIRHTPWLDTGAKFVAGTPRGGALLDLGSSDGETLGHMAELRPDLRFFAADKFGKPENYPKGCQFARADFETEKLPWPDGSINAITCMHLVEHLQSIDPIVREAARLLAPGGRIYFETPHPKSQHVPSAKGKAAGTFTLNFFDDPTHVRVVPVETLAAAATREGLRVAKSGISQPAIPREWPPPPASRQERLARVWDHRRNSG